MRRARSKTNQTILTRLGLDDSVDVVGAHQQILLAVDLDLVATELTVDDNVANLNVHGDTLTLVVDLASAHGNDGAALRLLLGVSSDKRDVEAAAAAGNPRAQLASDMLNYQIKKTIGSYIAAMGGVDAIVFTGGIGEHDADSRAKICHHMDWLGIRVDTDKNANAHKQNKDVVEITAWGAKVRTLVIETNEELMIARDTKEVLGNEGLL